MNQPTRPAAANTAAPPDLYTLAEVAEKYHLSLITLTRQCRAEKVRHFHEGRTRGMTSEQITAYLTSRFKGSTPPAPAEAEEDETERARRESRGKSRAGRGRAA